MVKYCYKCENCLTELQKTHGATESPDVYCYNCDEKMFKKIEGANISYRTKDFHGRKF